jgi:hypothetical protein
MISPPQSVSYYQPMPDLTDAEKTALIAELRRNADPFPLSPRIRTLRAILDKLQPPSPRAEPYPAPKSACVPVRLGRCTVVNNKTGRTLGTPGRRLYEVRCLYYLRLAMLRISAVAVKPAAGA